MSQIASFYLLKEGQAGRNCQAAIAPDWDLPTEAVQSGLETLRSYLELVRGNTALLYEMT